MHDAPGQEPRSLACPPDKRCTVPRPVGWLSTVGPGGGAILAPDSQWQNQGCDPPMVMFAANQSPDGRHDDTVVKAGEAVRFVWIMAACAPRDTGNISATAVPAHEDEFDAAGATKAARIDVPGPRVAESPAPCEDRDISTTRSRGASPVGWVDAAFDEVMRIEVADDVTTADGKLVIPKIQPIARMGGHDYTCVRDPFELRIPGATAEAADGLEGMPT